MHWSSDVLKKAIFCFIIVFQTVLSGSANAVEDSIHIAMPNSSKSLNYFDAADSWSQKVLRFFHMPLYVRGPVKGKMVPWLAESPPIPGIATTSHYHACSVAFSLVLRPHLRSRPWRDVFQIFRVAGAVSPPDHSG